MRPKTLFLLGILLLIGNVFYDLIFINIPPQDPPPELAMKRNNQYLLRDSIWYSGLALILIGFVGWLIIKARNRYQDKKN